MLRGLLFAVGLVLIAFGALFTLQGLGVVRWPASSFMIDQRVWVTRGLGTLATGLGCVFLSRRLGRRR